MNMLCVTCGNFKDVDDCNFNCQAHFFKNEKFTLTHYRHVFITPIQYFQRVGKQYPDRAPVWVFYNSAIADTGDVEGQMRLEEWGEIKDDMLRNSNKYKGFPHPVCAFGDNVPDEDWEPENESGYVH